MKTSINFKVYMLAIALCGIMGQSLAGNGNSTGHIPDVMMKQTTYFPDTVDRIYFQAGFGSATSSNYSGGLVGMQLSYKTPRFVISTTWNRLDEIQSSGYFGDVKSPNESMQELGVLYGWYDDKGKVMLVGSVGLSYIWGIERGAYLSTVDYWFFGSTSIYETKHYSTVGIPFTGEVLFGAKRGFNAGLKMHVNVNPENIYMGLSFNLRIGRAKPRVY